MKRAAIVVGVRRTGDLPPLEGVIPGADLMTKWLISEGFDVTPLTDRDNPVTAAALSAEISKIVERGVYDQLVVYFAGHGSVRGSSEYWLLSGAPRDPNEAVIVNESVDLARGAGIPSVVFISDACRSPAASLVAQRVRGNLIFPNEAPVSEVDVHVDRFFATRVGGVALELKVEDSPLPYEGVYTGCFLAAFRSPPKELRRFVTLAGKKVAVVPNRRLPAHLRGAVAAALAGKNIAQMQRPDAIVESDEDVFIGRVIATRSVVQKLPELQELDPVAVAAVGLGLRGAPGGCGESVLKAAERLFGRDGFAEATAQTRPFTAAAGFRVLGARVEEVYGLGCSVAGDGAEVHVKRPRELGSVIIRFAGGTGTVLAALRGFVGTVVVEDGRVGHVSYMPTRSNPSWSDYQPSYAEIAHRHRVIADASRHGVFRVESPEEASRLASLMRVMKSLDPTLGLYAAYAYAASGDLSRVQSVAAFMDDDLGGALFDVAMLAGRRPDAMHDRRIAPFVPMLDQGWPLLRGRRAVIPPAAEHAAEHRLESLWTTFTAPGIDILRAAFRDGEL